MSLDGKIEGPNGEYDWCFTDQDYGMGEFMKSIDTIFLGRKSYELVMKMDESGEYKDPYTSYTNYVFSKTLTKVKSGYTIISDNVSERIKEIKSGKGSDIWLFGGAGLTTSIIQFKLLDELWIALHPIILGPGKPMFSDLEDRLNLELFECKEYSSGLVSLKYSVLNEAIK